MKKIFVFLFTLAFFLTKNSFAYDENGEYITGGGVGSVICPAYLASLSQADAVGGINSLEGIRKVSSFMNYLLGFQTGHNSSHLGKKDVFERFGDTPTNKLLFLTQDWCAKNPTKTFGNAVVAIANEINELSDSDDKYKQKSESLFGI